MNSKAVVFYAKEHVVVQEIDVPPPDPQEIQVRSRYSMISAGTEGWLLRDLFTRVSIPFPFVPGYQRVGTVTAVGSEVEGWAVGDRALALISSWGKSDIACALGGHVALGNVATAHAYHLSDDIDDIDASNAVVAQVGYNAVSRAGFQAGDWVVVYGDGLIGQCAAQAARARGARVAVIGHRAERLYAALRHFADAVINSASEDVLAKVRKYVGGETVPVVIDSIQTVSAQKQYMDLLEPGRGQIIYCGFAPGQSWADMALLQEREMSVQFVNGWTPDRIRTTLALMASHEMSIRPLVTHLVPYQRAPEMYRMILDKKEPFLGIALDWCSSG